MNCVVLVGGWGSGEAAEHGVVSERQKKKRAKITARPGEEDSLRHVKDSISVDMEGKRCGMDQAAAVRRERLRALKAAQELLSAPEDQDKPDDANPTMEEDNPSMKFRNYLPHDKELQEGKLAPPVLPKFEDPVAAAPPPSEEKEDPFVNIAPKKPNWDLRRDVQKKLDKLERRTQKAIFKLMEEQEKENQLAEDGGNVSEDQSQNVVRFHLSKKMS